ncbi:hypothetical protein [Microbulbifer taiwanensis]|uniref:Uncharacterized protein n=1 Tax=Microbulbifer taiwanensis TaxID=986746 RepID=A0ABW1YLM4_9GAMM|nr:hypothetical protein [Microbulbifer taiwanensis]
MKLTEYLAIYAAALSTIVFFWNILSSRPRLRIRILPGTHGDDENIEMGVHISVQNTSAHVIHVSNSSVLYPHMTTTLMDKVKHLIKYKRLCTTVGWVHSDLSYYDVKDKFPASIEARKPHDIFIPERALGNILTDASSREIRFGVQDALWRSTYSKSFKIDWHLEGSTPAAECSA